MSEESPIAWIKSHAEEILTAVLTAFFTALMFRVGLGMLFSIVMGLVIAYGIRLFALRKLLDAMSGWVKGGRRESGRPGE